MAEKKVFLKVPMKSGDHDHAPIRLSVSKQDSVLWSCRTHGFQILRIRKDPHAPAHLRKPNAPHNPFFRPFPAGAGKKGRVSSGPPRPDTAGQQYKCTYRVGGHMIDPHIIIGG